MELSFMLRFSKDGNLASFPWSVVMLRNF